MELHSEVVVHPVGGVPLHAFLARPREVGARRPGVLVVHEWWGHDDYARTRARQLAELGFVAFAVDMYGRGQVAATPQEAGALMQSVTGDLALMRARFEAAREVLARRAECDGRIAAIGYCFGGAVVLQMARAGVDLAAVASFHPGSLATTTPAQRGRYRAKTLVCLGGADPFVDAKERAAFQREMEDAGADLEWVEYPGVQHGFTVPAASERGRRFSLPLAYDAQADRDSWERTQRLLARAFA